MQVLSDYREREWNGFCVITDHISFSFQVFGDYYHFRHRRVMKRSLSDHRGTQVRLDKDPKVRFFSGATVDVLCVHECEGGFLMFLSLCVCVCVRACACVCVCVCECVRCVAVFVVSSMSGGCAVSISVSTDIWPKIFSWYVGDKWFWIRYLECLLFSGWLSKNCLKLENTIYMYFFSPPFNERHHIITCCYLVNLNINRMIVTIKMQ